MHRLEYYLKDAFNKSEYIQMNSKVIEHEQFKIKMSECFIENLKKSDFFKEMIKLIKTSRINKIVYSMGDLILLLNNSGYWFSINELEDIYIMDGIDLDNNEEPTELKYQKELDVFKFINRIIMNDELLEKAFFNEFIDEINLAIANH